MPKAKPVQQTVDKWQRRAAVAQPEYTAGINNPRTPWAQAAQAAAQSYKTGVTQAAAAGAFEKGVAAAGDQKWHEASTKKGPARFVEGVTVSGPQYQEKISRVLQAIETVQLPARGPKGSPQNYQRITPIGEALRRAFGKGPGAK